jgi:hypothetical protein
MEGSSQMNAGVLQFSLGLATGGFLGPLGSISGHLKGFIGGLVGFGALTAGVMDAIKRGADLEALSKRTDTSVASLYQLQRGFQAVDLEAGSVGGVLFKLQKSMGGVNDEGQDTKSIFARLNLDIGALKKMGAPQQLLAIAGALSKMNISGASAAAAGIFGREGAASMVQLSRSTGEFSEAMRKAQADAQRFQRNAEAFHALEKGLTNIRSKVQVLFAGIADGLAPGLQAIEDMIAGIDLSSVGEQIGKIFGAFVQAFKEGSLAELIALTITTGFQIGVDALPPVLEKIGSMLIKVFETPLTYLQEGIQYAVESAAHALAGNKFLKAVLLVMSPGTVANLNYIGDPGKPNWKEIVANRKQSGLAFDLGTGEFGLGGIDADANKRWLAAIARIGNIAAPLAAMIDGLAGRARKPVKMPWDENFSGGESLAVRGGKGVFKPEANLFEKMGFITNGSGANPLLDSTRRIEKNTGDLVAGFKVWAGLMRQISPGLGVVNQL